MRDEPSPTSVKGKHIGSTKAVLRNPGITICTWALFLATQLSANAAECNPRLAGSLQAARRSGDAMFLATLPNLGLTDSADMELGGHGRKVIVLIKKRSNINILLARLNQRRDKNKESSRYDGLTTFKGFNVTGLTRTETYFFADGDVVSNLLTCDPPGSVASPSCTHLMLHGEFLIQANYGRDWLPKWHDIHALLVEAIDRCDIP